MSFKIGLTGGIASGKSTLSRYLKEKDIKIIDADQIAREVVQLGSPGLEEIINSFGPTILQSSGELDRKKLGSIVFKDSKKLDQLNQITGHYIRQRILEELDRHFESDLVVLDIPLLYESKYDEIVDTVIVSYIPRKIQIERLCQRDSLTIEEAIQRMNSQMSLELKKQKADYIVDNSGSLEHSYQQLEEILNQIKTKRVTGKL